ncbi:AAA family ATPase [Luteitalea sp.]|uniref:ATP-dependent nuclease n=1 Tax=Luteitalea sp. TaxID=2004800 RepID=UPI0025BE97B2|nr:AAA family ATPase [Luteitalea sp.]
MYLGIVRVQNFRNLQDITVVLKPGLNVLVGENNVGKSNLLDALRWALGVQSVGRDAAVLLDKEDRHRNPDGTYVDAPVHVELRFEALSADDKVEFLEILNFDEVDPSKSSATIHCEWTYSEARNKWTFRRWGGERKNTEGAVSDELLQALPLTFLEALRDAERELAPGKRSRLARYLDTAASEKDRGDIVKIGADGNNALKKVDLIKRAEDAVAGVLKLASGTDLMREAAIRPAPAEFGRLVQALRVLLKPLSGQDDDNLLETLDSNGLGYNNLIYIATVLAELQARKDSPLRMLVVEEPEAHLHPQLQTLLATHLAELADKVQTIVTTHSPTIAAHVEPKHLAIMHRDTKGQRCVVRVDACGLDKPQERQLRRVLDVTRASLLFAQGVILVEGISECLLLPVLAELLGINLGLKGVAVVPVGGVDFATIGRLFGEKKITVPLSILTDADPLIDSPTGKWRDDCPKLDAQTGAFQLCDRAVAVLEDFKAHPTVCARVSELTLEYDLAKAAPDNALCMFDAWKSCYSNKPKLLTREELATPTTADDRALLLWRTICRGSPQHGKAELAQALATLLQDEKGPAFTVPAYIEDAIRHAVRTPKPESKPKP